MTNYDDNATLGDALKDAFMTQDRIALECLLEPNVVWDLAGDNAVSGQVIGVDGIFSRFSKLAGYGVNINIEQITVNATGVAMILHNTGSQGGRVLDEWLVTTVEVNKGKAARLTSYLSDIPMMNAYFV